MGFTQAKGVTPWAYHLHSHRPNELPLKLAEILFSDAPRSGRKVSLDDDDYRKLAYIAGHLTHMAADQIIHPIVNSVAGPYYRSGENPKRHRECEVFQDYFLYEQVYRMENKTGPDYDFFEQDFRGWADCIRGLTARNIHDWFRYFLQRGFVETYGSCPEEDDIEDAVDGLLVTLRLCKTFGPYRKAAEHYERHGDQSHMYRQYVRDIKYLKHYRVAVELAVVYLIALYDLYFTLKTGRDFTDRHRKRFLNIVRAADLSCPLERNILAKATRELEKKTTMVATIKSHVGPLLTKTRFADTQAIMRLRSDRKVVTI